MIALQNDRRNWIACLLLAGLTVALYWPVRHFDFVEYDDPAYILNEPTVRAGLSWWGLAWSFVDGHAANWHPLTWLSHMLDCQLFGLNAGPHHLVNVFLHAANSALVFWVLRIMTGSFWRSALVAALFAWHPMHVESVAWISERKDVLSGFFFLLTLWAYAHYAKQIDAQAGLGENTKAATASPWRNGWYKRAVLLFSLGLLAKPMLVTTPCVLLLLDFWPLNRLPALNWKMGSWKSVSPFVREKIPFLILTLLLSVITFYAQKSGGAVISMNSLGFFSRIQNVVVGYFLYIEKLFWPQDMTFLYLRPVSVPLSLVLSALLSLLGISVFVAFNARRRPYLLVGWLWFLGIMVPVIGLVQVGLQSIADRYTYLSYIGLFVMAIWGAGEVIHSMKRIGQVSALVGATVLLIACACVTRQQLGYWRNTETLMKHALELNPDNYVAHINLGVFYSKQGNTPAALFHYAQSRRLDPAQATSPTNTPSLK